MHAMKPRLPPAAGAIAAALLLPACSAPFGYTVMMETRKEECRKLPDIDQRTRCLKEADLSYERYKAEAEAARRP